MTDIYARKKGTEFEIGDIIDVSMSIEYQIPPEDEEKSVIDLNDYDAKYEIHYSFPRKLGFSTVDFSVEAGFCPSFGDDIKQYIEESFEQDLEEIAEYELFDVDNTGEYQTAKIRIKALKEG
jgi:hypothetical protein